MPIKRHDAIAPLSRHHHHALIMALRISKLGTDPDPDEVNQLREDLKSFWVTGGQEHFREEEEILLPAFARHASIKQQVIIEMLLEHVQIRSLVDSIDKERGDVASHIRELGVLLEQHVRKEERIIFPLIEAALPEEELLELKPYFHEHSAACKLK